MMNPLGPAWKVIPRGAYAALSAAAFAASSTRPLYGIVLKYGRALISGIFAITPLAPLESKVPAITSILASKPNPGEPADGVITSIAPPDNAYE